MLKHEAGEQGYLCADCGAQLAAGVGPLIKPWGLETPLQMIWATHKGGFRPMCTVCLMLLAFGKITCKDL
jgi:hypothetical protein